MRGGADVRVGVIGTGIGARAVAPAFEATEGCTVVALVSPRDEDAVAALCTRDDVDLISVHSPPFLHHGHVRRAIEHGRAVLCDKPFGVNAVEAAAMHDFAHDAGIVGLVNYEFRYAPLRSKLREFVLGGVVGTVEQVEWTAFAGIWRTTARPFGWVFDAARGGGWVRAYASHCIDFFLWTFGAIVDVSAGTRTTIAERPDGDGRMRRCTAEDGFTATLQTERGAWITIDTTATAAVDRPMRVTVVGSDGVLEVLADDVHEVGGTILLHTTARSSELFRIEPWLAHHYTEMLPWVELVRDAVREGYPLPDMPTFADGVACARRDGRAHRPALMPVHPRLSVNEECAGSLSFPEEVGFWHELGVETIGAISPKLEAIDWDTDAVARTGLRVQNIGTEHRVVGQSLDFAAAAGADCVWFTTGTIGSRLWEEAADEFCERIAPTVARASELGVTLAVEPTNPLRADISFVFTLRDTLVLARAAGIDVVLELACCWYERGFEELVRDDVDRLALVQISDFELGTLDTPNRSVIGDGDIPLERLLGVLLDAGYEGYFDLEILGPRIEAEGYLPATRRSLERASEMLGRLGA